MLIRDQINQYDLSERVKEKKWKKTSLFLSIKIRQIKMNQRKKSYIQKRKDHIA